MDVEIIFTGNIKPATPTAGNLKDFKISIIDQLCANAYIPFLLFYPNNHQNINNNVISERKNLLKRSLSEVLVHFYPFAGEIKNDDALTVDCNDNGVFYVETEIKSQQLPDFLKHPKAKFLRKLFPYDPDLVQCSGKTFVIAVQVNIFSCGGVAFAVFFTHKIIDAYSIATFMKLWADIARGYCNETTNPCFDAPFVFPQNPALSKDASLIVRPPSVPPPKCVPRMFFFYSADLSELKKKASLGKNTSRVVSVVGLIWKSLISASKKINGFQKTSVLTIVVNLRTRASPPLPDFCIGNALWFATARFRPDNEFSLSTVIACLQDSIAEIDARFVEELKGDQGSVNMGERLRKLQEEAYSDEDAEYYCVSSWCNLGFLEVDFGFGKPSRMLHGCPDSDNPGVANTVLLYDSGTGDGIEALVSVSEDYMTIIEQDDELLRFSSTKYFTTT